MSLLSGNDETLRLFTYAGNKTKFRDNIQLAHYIITDKKEKKIDICIDLFAGTSAFFNMVQGRQTFKHTVLNDINKSITTLLLNVKDNCENLILSIKKEFEYIEEKYGIIDTQDKAKDWFEDRHQKLNELELEKNYDNILLSTYFYCLNNVPFGGNYSLNKNGTSKIGRSTDLKKWDALFDNFIKKIYYFNDIYYKNNVVITNMDYRTIIRDYGYENILYLIDPPYLTSNSHKVKGCSSNYKFNDFNHIELLDKLEILENFIYFNNKHILLDDYISHYDFNHIEIERTTNSSEQSNYNLNDYEYMIYR